VYLVFLALPPLLPDMDLDTALEQLGRVTRITLVQMIGVAVAIVPKQYFGFANEDLHGRTPWRFVFGAAVVAVALAFFLNLALLDSDRFPRSLPWLGMPLFTAGVLAYLVQDSRWLHWSLRRQRVADVILLLVGTTIALVIARTIQPLMGILPRPGYHWWYGPVVVLLTASGIGAFLPSACRHPARQRALRPQPRHQPEGMVKTAVRAHPTPMV
jgi:hypothetical protein